MREKMEGRRRTSRRSNSMRCIQVLLLNFSIIVAVLGAGVLGVGIWLRVDSYINPNSNMATELGVDLSDELHYFSYALIAVGVLILIMGCCGVYGAVKYSVCALAMYVTLTLLIVLLLLAVLIITAIMILRPESVNVGLINILQHDKYASKIGPNFTFTSVGKGMEYIQQKWQCCGFNSTSDYDAAKMQSLFAMDYPPSCCGNYDATSHTTSHNMCSHFIYKDKSRRGCDDGFDEFTEKHVVAIVVSEVVVTSVFILGLIFGICLSCLSRGRREQDFNM